MSSVKVRNVVIGEGIPKICVPLVGVTRDDIIAQAQGIQDVPVDVVEWRADWYEDVFDEECVEAMLRILREMMGDIPLLFTFRTSKEGGEKSIDISEYVMLNKTVAQSGYVDLVDVEVFTGDDVVREIIEEARVCGVKVIGSNHDFEKTPSQEEIVRRLCKMQELGVDIPKIAVMPQNKKDVLALLMATEEMTRLYADRPVITMSMAGTGMISRLCGEVFGSALTFGAVFKTSAPGQVEVCDLENVLRVIHKNL